MSRIVTQKNETVMDNLFAGLISSNTRIKPLVGNIDQYHLNDLSRKTENYINAKLGLWF